MPVPRSRTARCLALLGLLVALLALAACGGGDPAEDATEGLTPAQILQRSADAAEGLDTYTVAFDGTATIGADAGAGGIANLVNGESSVEGEARADAPDDLALDATVGFSGLPVQVSATKLGGDLYVGAFGQDYKLEVPAETVASFTPQALVPTLAGWITDPEEAGREEVDGTPTVHLRGGVDPQAVLRDLGPLLGRGGAAAPDPAAVADALSGSAVEVWVGTEDFRPRRVRVQLDVADAAALAPGLNAVGLDLTGTFADFDEPVQIAPPADASPLALDDLSRLTG